MTYNLDAFLSTHAFAFMMLFSRLGAVIMLFPGIGESYVPPRVRMMLTFMMSLLLLGPMLPHLPALPATPAETARLVLYEIIIGLFFATIVRLANSALEAAGMVIGVTTGLSNATIMNPAQASQSPLSGAFLSMAGLALIFVDRKSTRLNSSHRLTSRMPSSA
jgi:flagellar biosynthetic protein FliR